MATEALLTLRQTFVSPPVHVWIYLSSQNSWKKSLCWGGRTSHLAESRSQCIQPACSHIHWLTVKKASIYCLVFTCSFQVAFFSHFKGSISMGLPWKHAHAEEKWRRREREMGEGGRGFLILWWGHASTNGCSGNGNPLKWASTLSVSFD